MDHSILVGDFEVVGQGAVSSQSLGSDSGSSSDELVGLEVGHQALERVDEGGFVGAAPDFSEAGLPVVSGEAEEAGPGEGLGGVAGPSSPSLWGRCTFEGGVARWIRC